ncbi:MAG: alpha/beta fold hydrolase [Rhizobiales bacterium]|nr:alpha/beta fold hydrolase [Hyphomicrobiales bacterium]
MMRPLVFDDCAGWLHEADGALGVVVCGPQGYEQLCAQAALRELAERLAARGLPTLRFDYPGCGDSLGDDDEPARLETWRASVASAVAALRAATGARSVALVGLRLGGALALEAASTLEDVTALAMLAPVVSGRAYRREIAAFAAMTGGEADAQGAISVAGFRATADTLAALDRFDATKIAKAPRAIFLAAAPEQIGADKLEARLTALGVEVTRAPFEGYGDLLADPTFARAPDALFADVADWLAARAPGETRAAVSASAPASLRGPGFVDTPLTFDEGRLAGVLCAPEGVSRGRAILFLNAGANPRMGWARQTVRYARALARQGWTSLRIDVSGLGDSARRPDRPAQVPYSDAPQDDVIAAIDLLAARGFADVAVIGPCSGAHLGFHTAVRDPRIAQLAMINLQVFVWTPGRSLAIAMRQSTRSAQHYRRRLFELDTWRRLVSGDLDLRTIASGVAARLRRRGAERLKALAGRDADGATILTRFQALAERNQQVLLIYSDNDGGLDELAAHLGPNGARLARLPGMRVELLPDADHNLTSPDMQARLLQTLIAFLDAPAAAAAREPAAILRATPGPATLLSAATD